MLLVACVGNVVLEYVAVPCAVLRGLTASVTAADLEAAVD
jgi:hypothetical protein